MSREADARAFVGRWREIIGRLAPGENNDATVEAAYGVDFKGDEERIVAHLFKLYADIARGGAE